MNMEESTWSLKLIGNPINLRDFRYRFDFHETAMGDAREVTIYTGDGPPENSNDR
jgi:hypothetical protein